MQLERNGKDLKPFDSYYIAPTFAQARDIMYRLVDRLGEPWIKKSWHSSLIFEFVSGRFLHLKGADRPDRMRGVGLADAVLDEYATMRAEVWPYVVRPTLADLAPDSRALFIGTPSIKSRNHFYYLWKAAMDGKPGWQAWQYKTIDSPLIPKDEIEDARQSLSEHAFRVEYEADFGDASDCPLNPDKIVVEHQHEHDFTQHIVIGVRLQSFEKDLSDVWDPNRVDMTSICVVRMSEDKAHVLEMERNRFNVREICTRLLALDRKYRPETIAMNNKQYAAIEPHLSEREFRYGRALYINEVNEPENMVATRCTFLLQPLLDRERITFEDGDYLIDLKTQFGAFPDENQHDDMVRALAYACEHIPGKTIDLEDDWEPIDEAIGF